MPMQDLLHPCGYLSIYRSRDLASGKSEDDPVGQHLYLSLRNLSQFTAVNVYTVCYIITWNLFVLYFWFLPLKNKVFSNQNRGPLGSRYIYVRLVELGNTGLTPHLYLTWLYYWSGVCHRFRLHLKPSFITPGKTQAENIAFHYENLEMLTIS